MNLRQIFCSHKWKYAGLERDGDGSCMIYRCEKCGKVRGIYTSDVEAEIETCPLPFRDKDIYSSEVLYLPSDIYGSPYKYCGKRVAKVLERYDRKGINLRAYGRVECVMCDFDKARERAV